MQFLVDLKITPILTILLEIFLVSVSAEMSHLRPLWNPGPHPEGLSGPPLPQLWPTFTWPQAL